MFENYQNLRQNVTKIASGVAQQRNTFTSEIQNAQKLIADIRLQNGVKSNEHKLDIKKCVRRNLKCVEVTRDSLNALRKEVETELNNFDKDVKSVQRAIFKQKSMMREDLKREQHKTAKLAENEQNMEQRLKSYLKQKDDLQEKISELEGFLKDKDEKDLITEMKRFRSAAIVTSVTSLPEGGYQQISHHALSEHEKKAISLKSKLEKQISPKVNINEKVDEFIRSGGLHRYPIMQQEFVFEPSENDQNRFRFGTKFISISLNAKDNELYVKNDGMDQRLPNSPMVLLEDWIIKNGSNEMRKLLARISQKKKNKQVVQQKRHVLTRNGQIL